MELLRITRQIHCKAVELRATLIHRQYNRDWGTSYSRPPIDPYLTFPPVTKSWQRHCIVTLTGGRCPEAPRSSATLQQNCQRRPTAYTTRIAGHFNQRRRPQHAPRRQNGQSACVCTRRYRRRKSRAGEQKRILQRAYRTVRRTGPVCRLA